MADRTVKVTLTANVDGYEKAFKKATTSALTFNKTQQELAAKAKQLTQQAEWAGRANESQLQKLQRQAAEARKTSNEYNAAWNKMATGLSAVGGAMVGFAVGGMSMAVKGFAEFDAQMSNVAASTGASADDLVKLKQAAMDAGAEFGQFTSTDAAGALEELGKAGLNTTQSIAALRGVMGLAAADNMEVGKAAEVTAQALTMFSREGVTATQVADALAQGAGAAVGSAAELAEGLGNVGPVAASMGIKMSETVQTLALFAQNGIRGAEGGTQLKSMLLRLQNPTEQASKAMQELGISAYDANGNFVGMRTIFGQLSEGAKDMTAEQRDAALATVFGSHAVLSANIAMREGVEGYDDMAEAMASYGSAADMAKKRTDNLVGDWKNFTGVLENVGIKMGETANGPLRKLVQQLTSLAEWAQRNTTTVQVLLGISGALGGVALAAGGMMKATKSIAEFKESLTALGLMSKLTTVTGGFKKTFTDIGGIVKGGITALGEFKDASKTIGLASAAKQGAGFKNFFSTVVGGASSATKAVLGFGAVGVAIAGVTAALIAMKDAADEAYERSMAKSDDWKKSMSEGIDEFNDKLDTIKWDYLDGNSTAQIHEVHLDIGSAIARSLQGGSDLSAAPLEQINKTIEELDKSLAEMPLEDAYQGFASIKKYADASNVSLSDLASKFPQYSQRLHELADEQGYANISSAEFNDWMGGKIPEAVAAAQRQMELLKNGMDGTGQSVLDFTAATEGSASALQQQANATKEVVSDLTAYADATVAMMNGAIAVKKATAAVTESVKQNGKSVDINTTAGQANMEALTSLISSYSTSIKNAQNAGVTGPRLQAMWAAARTEVTGFTKSVGLAGKAVDDLIGSMGDVPQDLTTSVKAVGATMATEEVEAFVKGTNKIPDSVITQMGLTGYQATTAELEELRKKITGMQETDQINLLATFQIGGMDAVDKAIAEINRKKAEVQVIFSPQGTSAIKSTTRMIASAQADGSVMQFYARGGMTEKHIAQLAPAGAWRVWAEPETGGEAYIPLAASKRARSEAILAEVARRFGMRLERYAGGGIRQQDLAVPLPRTITTTSPRVQRTQYATAPAPIVVQATDPAQVATAVKQALSGLTWVMDGRAIDVRLNERDRVAAMALRTRGI